MKQPEVAKYLADALRFSQRARRVLGDMTADDLLASEDSQLMVDRVLELVGEALRRAYSSDASLETRITNGRGFVRLRNVIAHGYEILNYEVLWRTIKYDLPILERELEALLAEHS